MLEFALLAIVLLVLVFAVIDLALPDGYGGDLIPALREASDTGVTVPAWALTTNAVRVRRAAWARAAAAGRTKMSLTAAA